jgi:CRP/FNR family transcriptional regulator, cyclic AMP receptor protein
MKKILLIEDDNELRENIAEILNLSNYETITATDGKIGIEKALKESPDLILCDIMMPNLDGFGVLHILSRYPETKTIPFIFLTAKDQAKDFRKGMEIGADDYLIKPLNETELIKTVALRLKKSEDVKIKSTNGKSGFDELIKQANNFHSKNHNSEKYEVRQYPKKHLLYAEDQRPTVIYYVISGKLKEFKLHEEGKELITSMYTNSDFIGYRAVLEELNYTESVQIIEEAELMLIPRNDFIDLINNDITVTKQFISILSKNLHHREDKLLNMAYNSLRKKVAFGILEVADKFKNQRKGMPIVEISRDDLAHVVGSAPESMIRTLKEFKNEKLIDVQDGGSIVVINDQKLRHLLY